jgi:DnaK suppressor protein
MTGTPEKKAERDGVLTKEKLEVIRQSLLQKRSELVRNQATQLDSLHSPEKHHLADLEELASDSTDTDSVCALVDLGSTTLAEINKALEKIQGGSYGYCDLCEEPIHPERLETLPFASLCVECQRRKEKTVQRNVRQEEE